MADSHVQVVYSVPRWSPGWAITQTTGHRSPHAEGLAALGSVLDAWIARTARLAKVARNLPIQWVAAQPHPGLAPDLCLLDPAPFAAISSLRTWQPEQRPPKLVVVFISHGHPHERYFDLPDRCAACGVSELWLYDPSLSAAQAHGGPQLLQVWALSDAGRFERNYAGPGPAYSALLSAWLHPTTDDRSTPQLRLADGEDSTVFWPDVSEQRSKELDRSTLELQVLEEQRDALERQVEALSSRLDGKS